MSAAYQSPLVNLQVCIGFSTHRAACVTEGLTKHPEGLPLNLFQLWEMKELDVSMKDGTSMDGEIALFMVLNLFFNQKLRKEIQEISTINNQISD